MNSRCIAIAAALLVGGWIVWNKFGKRMVNRA